MSRSVTVKFVCQRVRTAAGDWMTLLLLPHPPCSGAPTAATHQRIGDGALACGQGTTRAPGPVVGCGFLSPHSADHVTVSDRPATRGLVCHAVHTALRLAARPSCGVGHVSSIRQVGGLTFVLASNGGETTMPRATPHTAATITAISEGFRAARVVFLRDGVVDADEMGVLRAFRAAQAEALRADWSRRARQSVENDGGINPRLEREYREIEAEYPLDSA